MRRQWRLRSTKDFQRVRNEGRLYHHPLLLLSAATNQLAHNRYGFIVGKRVGKAVIRNQAKRKLREIVRLLHPQLEQGYDIIIIARPACHEESFHTLSVAVTKLAKQAGLFKEEESA